MLFIILGSRPRTSHSDKCYINNASTKRERIQSAPARTRAQSAASSRAKSASTSRSTMRTKRLARATPASATESSNIAQVQTAKKDEGYIKDRVHAWNSK